MADGSVKIDIEADSSKFESELNEIEIEAKKGAAGLDDLGDSAEKAGDGLNAADVAAGTFIANGLANLISGVMEAAASLVDLADSTREYREDMAKLETAFSSQGHSAEIAGEAYESMYKILGESDRSVEAANHLAGLVESQEDLTKWSNIAAGTLAVFQDSLPTESLTESAAQTAELGKLTGPLVDVLSRAGISEEEFNKQLEACANQQERAALITETLNSKYSEAAAEYNELTESTQNARLATAEMEEAQANVGAALEPVTTAWTNFKANALEAILPVIQWVADAIMDLNTWLKEHETAATIITGVVIALAAAFGVFAAALGISMLIQLVTSAIASLGAVMAVLASPITIIVAVIAALAAGFIYLWNNCEGFREFWIGLWEGIKEAAAAVADWFNATWPKVVEALKKVWEPVAPYFSAIWETIKGIFSVVKAVLSGNFSDAWIAIKGIVGVWVQYFSGVWANIKGVFAVVGGWFRGIFQDAKDGIAEIWDTITGYFSGVWANIKGVFAVVSEWFRGIFQGAKDAITGIWDTIAEYFTGVWDDIKGVFGDAVSVGEQIVADLKSGIASAWDGIVSWFNGLWDRLFSRSATVKTNSDGTIQATPLKTGLDYVPYDGFFAMLHKGERVLTAEENAAYSSMARASVGASGATVSRSAGRSDSGFVDLARAVGLQTAGISSLSAQYRAGAANSRPIVLELDGRELGRAVVDIGNTENNRRGVKLALGGAL